MVPPKCYISTYMSFDHGRTSTGVVLPYFFAAAWAYFEQQAQRYNSHLLLHSVDINSVSVDDKVPDCFGIESGRPGGDARRGDRGAVGGAMVSQSRRRAAGS